MKIYEEGVDKNATDILNNVKNFEDEIKKLNRVIDNINTAWKGSDAIKYINAMKSAYIPELKELARNIEACGKYLQSVPKAYQTLDDIFSSKNIDV